MELLIITAAEMFEKDIKQMLKKSGVTTFSYMNITGYKDPTGEPMESNWFASNIGEHASILFHAFVHNNVVDKVIGAIDEMNAVQQSESRIHLAILDIKKSNTLKEK